MNTTQITKVIPGERTMDNVDVLFGLREQGLIANHQLTDLMKTGTETDFWVWEQAITNPDFESPSYCPSIGWYWDNREQAA